MGIFSSLSDFRSSIKTKFADEDFRDKLNGIGSALQGDDKAYENFTKRKAQRHSADDVANAIANGEIVPPMAADPNAPQSDLGTVQMPQLLSRPPMRSPALPILQGNGQRSFIRRF